MVEPNFKKIKILYIHHGSGYGGAPISLFNLVTKLDKNKYDLKVLFIRECEIISKYKKENIDVEVLNSNELYFKHHEKSKLPYYKFYKFLLIYLSWRKVSDSIAPKYFLKNNFDIVHLNSDVLSAWASAARKAGLKVICHNRDPIANGVIGFRKKILQSILDKNVDVFFSISNDNKDRLGLPKKTKVVYNFIPIPETFREPFSTSSEIRILYLGGIRKEKGFEIMVDSIAYLNKNIKVILGGNLDINEPRGNFLIKAIKKRVKNVLNYSTRIRLAKLKKLKNVYLLGHTKDPLKWINECDILIAPFTVPHFSRPAMEALAYGKPVVASDIEGMDEIVENEVNGLLFSNKDNKSLASAINYLVENPILAQKMGQEGRKKAIDIFSPEKNQAIIEKTYSDIMNGGTQC